MGANGSVLHAEQVPIPSECPMHQKNAAPEPPAPVPQNIPSECPMHASLAAQGIFLLMLQNSGFVFIYFLKSNTFCQNLEFTKTSLKVQNQYFMHSSPSGL